MTRLPDPLLALTIAALAALHLPIFWPEQVIRLMVAIS
jgi:hypothetical protein